MATSTNSGGLRGLWNSITGRGRSETAPAAAAPAGADGETKPLKRSQAKPENAEVQPSARVYRKWNPRLLEGVLRQADGGSMAALGDLTDQILADDRVAKAYDAVVGGLLSLDLTFEPAGDGRRRGRAAKALDAGEDWWRAFPETELKPFISSGLLAGVVFGQLRWEPWNRRIIPRLETWNLGHFRYDTRARKWFARVGDGLTEVEVNPGDGRWVMYAPYGAYRPWARGQWRGLSRLWLLKQYAISDSGRLGEKNGALVATPQQEYEGDGSEQPGSIKETRRKLVADLASLAAEGVIVLPNGFTLDLLHTPANTDAIYKTQWEFANTSIDITLQGQNLTSEVKEGSRAAADVHGRVEARIIRFVGMTVGVTLHDQALTWWAAFNFGDPDIAPWPTWDTDVPEDTKAFADALKAFGEGLKAVQDAGFEVENLDEIADKYGLKLKKKEPANDNEGEPKPGKGDDEPEGDADGDDEDPEGRSRREFIVALGEVLASAAGQAGKRGFVEGQLYVDAVVDYLKAGGSAELADTIDAIKRELAAAEDQDDLRARLHALYPTLSHEGISDLIYKGWMMSELGGIRSVTQEAS